jgi:large subunit ribosomal protein L17
MRHLKHGKKLGRKSAHRTAMWSNLVTSLLEHERIKTTDVKAKELRRLAEKTIQWSTSLGDVLIKGRDKLDNQERARLVHSMRMARRMIRDPAVLTKLFEDIGPRFIGRTGGYTRVIKFHYRHGDAAPISIVELVEKRVVATFTVSEKEKEG